MIETGELYYGVLGPFVIVGLGIWAAGSLGDLPWHDSWVGGLGLLGHDWPRVVVALSWAIVAL